MTVESHRLLPRPCRFSIPCSIAGAHRIGVFHSTTNETPLYGNERRRTWKRTMHAFTAEQFTPTKWDAGQTKANFARQFVKFVESDFDQRLFSQAFYRRLSMTFGHIAHFNRQGFFETFFSTTADKVRFLRMTLVHPCFGDPAFR